MLSLLAFDCFRCGTHSFSINFVIKPIILIPLFFQLRQLIRVVLEFTNHTKVHILAFSFGGALSRKAILGGKCVDKDWDLGPPLTDNIDAYLSIAGVQQGAKLCENDGEKLIPACNLLNGMKCGSKFLEDINQE